MNIHTLINVLKNNKKITFTRRFIINIFVFINYFINCQIYEYKSAVYAIVKLKLTKIAMNQ
jgi:hypothetical protein